MKVIPKKERGRGREGKRGGRGRGEGRRKEGGGRGRGRGRQKEGGGGEEGGREGKRACVKQECKTFSGIAS